MKNYIFTSHTRGLIEVNDTDFSTAKTKYSNNQIDYYWLIEEDGVFHFNGESYDVKKGDVVFSLYGNNPEKPRDIIIASLEGFHKNMQDKLAVEKEREEKRKVAGGCDVCSDCECTCIPD